MKVPEEAVEAAEGVAASFIRCPEPQELREAELEAAAPAIRAQERERVLAEFEKKFVDSDLLERIEAKVRQSERERIQVEIRNRLTAEPINNLSVLERIRAAFDELHSRND